MRVQSPRGADAANLALPLSIPDWWTPAIRAWSAARDLDDRVGGGVGAGRERRGKA